jgi:aryl carrier-like protein
MINADNEMVYLGRADRQVKIRGYRVELEEISSKIMEHEAVGNCMAVLFGMEQAQSLYAFVVPEAGTVPQPEAIRAFAIRSLPTYMVPDEIFCIDEMPITQNGKIDEGQLKTRLEGILVHKTSDRPHVPQTQRERILHQATSCVLGTYDLDMQKSFSDLGGDSIKAILLLQRLERENYHLDVKEILVHRPLNELSACMTYNLAQCEPSPPSYGAFPLPPVVRRFIKTQNVYQNTCFHSVHLLFQQSVTEQRLQMVFFSLLRAHRSLTLNLSKDGDSLFYNPRHFDKTPVIFSCTREDVYQFNLYEDLLIRMIKNEDICEIVINHLVIDYVSWQILLQDIHYLLSGSEIQELPFETASYGEYASELMVQSGGLFERRRLGTDTLRKMYSYQREGLLQRVRQTAAEKDQSLTQWLYQQFVQSASEYFGLTELEIELEDTGRKQIDERYWHTVGWFTAFSYVKYRKGDFSRTLKSEQTIPVIRFNFLGHTTEQYEVFSVAPLQKELLAFKNEDALDYFLQMDCWAASDTCLSFCMSANPLSSIGVAADAFMETFFNWLDTQVDCDNVQNRPMYVDEEISEEDLAVLLGEN